jgi:hypothetical protein
VEDLKTVIGELRSSIGTLVSRVKILDNKCGVVSSTVPCGAAAPKVTSAAPTAKDEVVDGDDANVDLFGSDSEVRWACKWVEFTLLVLGSKNCNILCNFLKKKKSHLTVSLGTNNNNNNNKQGFCQTELVDCD